MVDVATTSEQSSLACCVGRHSGGVKSCSPLEFLAPQLYLYSFLLSDDAVMLHHWIRHYLRLGVLPTNTAVTIRVREGASRKDLLETIAVLKKARVPRESIRILNRPPSDDLKMRAINRHLASLPTDAWAIYADVDELFDYPCDMSRIKRKKTVCLTGGMCDQMAFNGNISELQYEPDVSHQFPLSCRVRQRYFSSHMKYFKTILHKVRTPSNRTVEFRSTHAVGEGVVCEQLGTVRHYTMTAAQMRGNHEKMVLEARSINGVALNYANASCSTPYGGRKHPLQCKDYATLYGVQLQQVERVRKHGEAIPTNWLCPGCKWDGNRSVCKPFVGCGLGHSASD